MNRFQKGIALVCALVLLVSLFVPALSLAEVAISTKADVPGYVNANADMRSIRLYWEEVPGATSYLIYRGTKPSVSTSAVYFTAPAWALVTFKNGQTQPKNPHMQTKGRLYSFEDTKVTVGTPYFYKVAAVVNGVKSARSSATGAVAYSKTPTFKITKTTTGVKVVWTAVAKATEYVLARETHVLGGLDNWTQLKNLATRSFVDKTALPGKAYDYNLFSGYFTGGVRVDTGFFYASYLVPKAAPKK